LKRTLTLAILFSTSLRGQDRFCVPALVKTYCAGCHGGGTIAGARVPVLDANRIAGDPAPWSRGARHLRAGAMPPVGARRPDTPTVENALAAIERDLDGATPLAETSEAMATRLALLLWNTAPDAELAEAGKRGRLREPQILESHASRLLADPRAET
jgi:hypothetical protein